jgi:hypothetical protein
MRDSLGYFLDLGLIPLEECILIGTFSMDAQLQKMTIKAPVFNSCLPLS